MSVNATTLHLNQKKASQNLSLTYSITIVCGYTMSFCYLLLYAFVYPYVIAFFAEMSGVWRCGDQLSHEYWCNIKFIYWHFSDFVYSINIYAFDLSLALPLLCVGVFSDDEIYLIKLKIEVNVHVLRVK